MKITVLQVWIRGLFNSKIDLVYKKPFFLHHSLTIILNPPPPPAYMNFPNVPTPSLSTY